MWDITKQCNAAETLPWVLRLSQHLDRPVAILDTETTGFISPRAGLVEIAVLTINPEGIQESRDTLIHPGMSIPPMASRIHGIYDRDVRDAPRLNADLAQSINYLMRTHAIGGYNSRAFDVPFICGDLQRNGFEAVRPEVQIDVQDIWRRVSGQQKGKLVEVAEHYGVQVDGPAHRALADVQMTAGLLNAMIERHGMDAVFRPQPAPGSGRAGEQARARSIIATFVEQRGHVHRDDYAHLSRQANASRFTISVMIGQMLESGHLQRDQVVDPEQQAWIGQHLEAAILEAGSTQRLKPIKEALDRRTDIAIDYVQLRIALKDREQKNDTSLESFLVKAEKASSHSPSM